MRHRAWTVFDYRMEADLAIALDAQDIDIIISKDSDMMAYQSVKTLWPPVSNNLILAYKILDVLATLDAREIVAAYLTHGQVIVKNTEEVTFENSIRVFILLQKEPIQPLVQESQAQQLFRVLQDRFKELCIKHESLKSIRAAGARERNKDDVVRLPSPKSFNRYRKSSHPRRTSSIGQDADSQEQMSVFVQGEETVNNPTPAKKATSKANKPPPNIKPIADKDKKGLLRSLSWHHPTAWLELGTVEANARRVSGDAATLTNPGNPLNRTMV
ncbi:hypothetical protein BGX30_004889 [Mortierella sp. GBA39]|nr:hypothetical protein BGX30_004889 [Mortierella sp. GBA39]